MAAMGYGYGSECHLLRWMGRHRMAFDAAVQAALGTKGSLQWVDCHFDHKKDWSDAERKGLDFIAEPELQKQWTAWWPQGRGIHNWDAVGCLNAPDHPTELILVEAKANLAELGSSCKGGKRSTQRISQSLRETAAGLGATFTDAWLDGHYQLANRLAAAHFLRKQGYGARLLMIYFVGDKGNRYRVTPQRVEDWAEALRQQDSALKIDGNEQISQIKHRLFLHVAEPSAWTETVTPTTQVGATYTHVDLSGCKITPFVARTPL